MEFFKVLTQTNFNTDSFSKKRNISKMIVGNSGYSFALKYSPNEYQTLLSDENFYNFLIELSVKQLLMSNWKFIQLTSFAKDLKIELVDCELIDDDIGNYLQEEDFDFSLFLQLVSEYDFRISKLFFRTTNQYMIVIMNNGVIGLDEEILDREYEIIAQLLDFLSYGKVIVHEK
ncbi:hypothetical protein HED42_11115 [Enterococcus casseliflavus]|uniref:hypothetical protein n=1 Tax=Enterococcus casseliflavus TaxID=37734 RepID=UPI001432EB74|nr:hypothetical protein [Enterococcus casseliflavus]NKD38687.1 hypothetical protein [Enterococcus casseliflavus]